MSKEQAIRVEIPQLPTRRYLSRREAASWYGVSVDTFDGLDIPYVVLGPRNHRWDIIDLVAFAEQNKVCDSARASKDKRRYGQKCVSTNETVHPCGGSVGQTRTESEIAEVLELKTSERQKRSQQR